MEYANCAGHIKKKRGETASSNTYSQTSEIIENCRKRYVDYLKDKSKLTCLIHGIGHSLDK